MRIVIAILLSVTLLLAEEKLFIFRPEKGSAVDSEIDVLLESRKWEVEYFNNDGRIVVLLLKGNRFYWNSIKK